MSVLKTLARDTYKVAIDAVNPYRAVKRALRVNTGNKVLFSGKDKLRLDGRNVYCCAFGKAGYEMFRALDEIIPQNLAGSVLSLPIGQKGTAKPQWKSPHVKMFFGAANNIADQDSLQAAKEIHKLALHLTEEQVFIALISGGGSALLPLPCEGISIEDKRKVTKALVKKGASIQELNIVRKALSLVKGGGLLTAAQPATVLSLILSDIIGDPPDLIASAPTVIDQSGPQDAYKLISKYNLIESLPHNVVSHLRSRKKVDRKLEPNYIRIVGSNRIALDAASAYLRKANYEPFIISDCLCGEARKSGQLLAELVNEFQNSKNPKTIDSLFQALTPNQVNEKDIQRMLLARNMNKPLALLLGGETTVLVKGSGIGGRNQEIALAASLKLQEKEVSKGSCMILAAGTDGIDGPTEAAGAFGYNGAVSNAEEALASLDKNDSYNYHKQAGTLFTVGHTGTNVMDIAMALIN